MRKIRRLVVDEVGRSRSFEDTRRSFVTSQLIQIEPACVVSIGQRAS